LFAQQANRYALQVHPAALAHVAISAISRRCCRQVHPLTSETPPTVCHRQVQEVCMSW
jgi:hypothetical protein